MLFFLLNSRAWIEGRVTRLLKRFGGSVLHEGDEGQNRDEKCEKCPS
jgi:hypothetical protein